MRVPHPAGMAVIHPEPLFRGSAGVEMSDFLFLDISAAKCGNNTDSELSSRLDCGCLMLPHPLP